MTGKPPPLIHRILSLFIIVMIILLMMLPPVRADGDSWTPLRNMPTSRWGLAGAVVNGQVYAIGGGSSPNEYNVTEEYFPSNDTWVTRAPMKTTRYFLGATSVNGKIYAVGGKNATATSNALEEYDPASDTWTTRAPMLTRRSALGVAALNGLVYAVGGSCYGASCSSITSNVTEAYNPLTNTWTSLRQMPVNTVVAYAAATNTTLYVIQSGTSPTALLEAYTPANDTWNVRSVTFIGPSGSADTIVPYGLASVGGHLYTVGTEKSLGGQTVDLKATAEYFPNNRTWVRRTSAPVGSQGMTLVASSTSVFGIGGTRQGTTPDSLGTNEVYTPWFYVQPVDFWSMALPYIVVAIIIGVFLGAGLYFRRRGQGKRKK